MIYQQLMKITLGVSSLFLLLYNNAYATDTWQFQTHIQGSYGNYVGSSTRKNISSEGVLLHGNYLDDGGFSLGLSSTQLQFKGRTVLNQQGVYASVDKHVYMDALPGVLTLRLDGHHLSNNDATGNSNRVNVLAPQVSFLNYGKNFYADLGLAYSKYPKSLNVIQLTPTLGFGFNQAADWLQLRGYWVKPSNAALAQHISQTTALETTWKHWFEPSFWLPHSISMGALLGQRIYAVDNDAAAVYNLADVQQGSLSLSGEWEISQAMAVILAAGDERYRNKLLLENYDSRYIYLDVKGAW